MERDELTRACGNAIANALRNRGIDPNKIIRIQAFDPMLQMVLTGKWKIWQFLDNCEKLLIINPKIALEQKPSQVLWTKLISNN